MLTDTQIRNAKPHERSYRLYDGPRGVARGLYLEVAPAGGKWWRFKYRFKGAEKRLALGVYPDVGLREARDKRDAARRQLAAGIDPGAARKAEKAAEDDTFEAVAREWHGKHAASWSPYNTERILHWLEHEVFPWIGSHHVGDIQAPDLLAVLRRIEHRGGAGNLEHRVLRIVSRVCQYAIATGRAQRNPARDLEGALQPVKKGHYAAITEPKEVGALLRAIDGYRGSFVVQCALKLAAYTFVRPGELRGAEWGEMDLIRVGGETHIERSDEWRLPDERMKMKKGLIVPLSYQAAAILTDLHARSGTGRYVFPGHSSGTLSENTLNAALRSMGFPKERMTAHGFRAMARTLLDEVLQVRPDIIEHQLAHQVKDPNGRAYNRTKHLVERRRMMQEWADYLDGLKNGADVIPLRKAQ